VLIWFVSLICFIWFTNKRDKPNNGLLRLAEFFSILLGGPKPSVEQVHNKTSGCHTCRKHGTDYPSRRDIYSSRFTTSKLPIQIRHMGFGAEPFIL